jgi:heme-degrading monooxygenase HmoA
LFILEGGPKPAFYEGILPIINSKASALNPDMDNGWRKVESDGINFIAPDSFVIQNKFSVPSEKVVDFEKTFMVPPQENAVDGFVAFYLQRREAEKADDGFNYISTSIWKSRKEYEGWKSQSDSTGQKSCPQCPSSLMLPSKVSYFEGKLTIYGPM